MQMDSIAEQLNKTFNGNILGNAFSDFGKRFYLPMGIIKQSQEAIEKNCKYNLTVAMASEENCALYLKSIYENLVKINPDDIFPYAPAAGLKELRERWVDELVKKNPSLQNKSFSFPVVTSGLTHSLLLIADLFFGSEDTIVLPDLHWGNYNLTFNTRKTTSVCTYPFFKNDQHNVYDLERELRKVKSRKKIFLLNFPNNPTGYSLNHSEVGSLIDMIERLAEEDFIVMPIIDDAYFGLLYEKELFRESLFSLLADLHENVFAVKVDGASKEEYAWGLRIGFLTFASKGLNDTHYYALEQKCTGLIRSSISSTNRLSQSLLLLAFNSENHDSEKNKLFSILKTRYDRIVSFLSTAPKETLITPLPFNAGYFMTFKVEGNAHTLRTHLINKYGIGTIAFGDNYLRIAFSRIPTKDIEKIYETIYKAAEEICDIRSP